MPVILPVSQIDTWRDPTISSPVIGDLLKGLPEGSLDCYEHYAIIASQGAKQL